MSLESLFFENKRLRSEFDLYRNESESRISQLEQKINNQHETMSYLLGLLQGGLGLNLKEALANNMTRNHNQWGRD